MTLHSMREFPYMDKEKYGLSYIIRLLILFILFLIDCASFTVDPVPDHSRSTLKARCVDRRGLIRREIVSLL